MKNNNNNKIFLSIKESENTTMVPLLKSWAIVLVLKEWEWNISNRSSFGNSFTVWLADLGFFSDSQIVTESIMNSDVYFSWEIYTLLQNILNKKEAELRHYLETSVGKLDLV